MDASPAVSVHRAPLGKRMLQGAKIVIGLMLFNALFQIENVRRHPLMFLGLMPVVALGGAIGGAAYYGTDPWRAQGGWRKIAANVASLLAYLLAVVAMLLIVLVFTGRTAAR
jgi:hypothetical protein